MLVDGLEYWCIKNSIEAESYQDPILPQYPWKGTLKLDTKGAYRTYYLHHNVNDDDDNDNNSKALVSELDLFNTLDEAVIAYIQANEKYIKLLQETICEVQISIEKAKKQIKSLQERNSEVQARMTVRGQRELEKNRDIHTEHCTYHSCKYGQEDCCPVYLGYKFPSFPYGEYATFVVPTKEEFKNRRDKARIMNQKIFS